MLSYGSTLIKKYKIHSSGRQRVCFPQHESKELALAKIRSTSSVHKDVPSLERLMLGNEEEICRIIKL